MNIAVPTPLRKEDDIIRDLRTLTSLYEMSKKCDVPMSSSTIMKCVAAILEKEIEPRDREYIG